MHGPTSAGAAYSKIESCDCYYLVTEACVNREDPIHILIYLVKAIVKPTLKRQ